MRKLAAFTVSFALGICLAQYLLPERLLLPVAAVFFAAACLALLLPGLWRKRVLLVGTGLALALGWNWLYSYAVRAPLAALSGSEGTASMTLLEYAVPTDYGAKVTVKLEGVPLGKVVCYGGADLLDLEPGQTVAAQVKFQDSARLREDTITNFTAQGVFLLAYQRKKQFDALADSYKRDAALGLPVDKQLLKQLVTAQDNFRNDRLTPADAAVIASCRQYALEARLVNPSAEFDVDTPIAPETEPEVDVLMPVNGYEAKILLIRNHSGRTQYFRPRWEAKGVPAPQLRRMIPVGGFFDAMPPLPFDGVFEVADGETRGIWIDLRSRDWKPGVYRGTLVFTPLDPAAAAELRVPVRQTVAAIESPKELPVAVFNWDYGVTKDQADYEFLRNARVNVFHIDGGYDAKEAVNWEKSNLKQVLDRVDANGDRGKVTFFLENWFTGAADRWNADLDNYYLQLAAYMKSRGYRYDQWIVHCFDEVLNDKFLNGAKNIKRLDPQIRIFSDPPPATAEQLRPFLPYLDCFCLGSWFLQEDANNGNKAVELLRSTGKPLWIYECDSQPRHPLNNYRRMALNSVQRGWDGFTFWSLTGLQFRHASITPPEGVVNYGMTYLDENGVRYPSRRWALWELGIDDYALVAALRQKGIDVSGEIRTMCGTKDAAALDEAMEAFKKEKLKAFIPGEK